LSPTCFQKNFFNSAFQSTFFSTIQNLYSTVKNRFSESSKAAHKHTSTFSKGLHPIKSDIFKTLKAAFAFLILFSPQNQSLLQLLKITKQGSSTKFDKTSVKKS